MGETDLYPLSYLSDYKFICHGTMADPREFCIRSYANSDPSPTEMARSETAKEKRDRLSREENKRSLEASKRGGKRKF